MKAKEFQKQLGFDFQKPELLSAALTHKSYHYEARENSLGHNEKLEFLGDAVLDLVLSEYLMELFPESSEGSLSKKRASLVNEAILAQIALTLKLHEYLSLGKGELTSGGEKKPRILSSTYEALIGSIFLDQGYEKTKIVVRGHFFDLIKTMKMEEDFSSDYKTRLQEIIQSEKRQAPAYKVIQESGPSHDKLFHVHLYIQDGLMAEGKGRSKKTAEQDAARQALELLKNQGRC